MIFFISLLCICCKQASDDHEEPIKNHVVLIGLDGWGAYSLPKADMPVVKEMMTEGAYTLKARSILPSVSAPNWASMFSGTGPEIHGFTANTETPSLQPPVTDQYGFTPTIFSLLHEQKPLAKIGFFYEWPGMKFLFPNEVIGNIQLWTDLSSDKNHIEVIGNYIKTEKPELLFIAFDGPDRAGHSSGHDTPEYYAELTKIDGYIGIIRQSVIDAGIYEDTVFILSSDHGGIEKGHGGNTAAEREIPFIVYGKNSKENHRISSNVMIYDIAPTIAYIFNLTQPQIWTGKPVYEVFKNE
jgi:predicted AlkP superfamily pyrophosphatase or phosphodiesterase